MVPEISVRTEGPVYRIELNRPDCGNLVTTEMVFALTDAVARLPAEAKLLVLSGKGADFCKGRDPQTAPEAARGGRAPSALELRERMAGPIYRDHLLPALVAVKAVKEYLRYAPLMEPRGRAGFAASVIAGVLSSR